MNEPDTIILVSNYGMGNGDQQLRQKLIHSYLTLLSQQENLPYAICFYTEGVKLVVDGSPVLSLLENLEHRGVRLIVCTTCLNYYNLIDQLRVGIAGSMADILEAQLRAQKVISL
ncbi:MAG TPA: DsrE family protein [Anaerolineaceae bacterium]